MLGTSSVREGEHQLMVPRKPELVAQERAA